jgi:hypothetical protein
MAGPVTDAHRIMFRDNFVMALADNRNEFENAMQYDGNLKGKQIQVADVIGTVEAIVNAPEKSDTPDIQPSHEPVWVRPTRITWAALMSKEDAVRGLTVPNSTYIQNGVKAIGRIKSQTYADALLGPRLIGNEVPVSTPWSLASTNTVGIQVGSTGDNTANTNMNVAKFMRALRLLEENDVNLDEEEIFAVLDPFEMEGLMRDPLFTSKDYRDKAVLEEKRVKTFMNVNIISSRRIRDAAANQSQAVFFCKSGFVRGDFMPVEITSQPNPTKEYREHPFAETYIGASRILDGKVLRVLNAF